jgi:hypothetical protein
LAAEYRVAPAKVLTWIKSGELRAVNVATGPHGRPRFIIDRADVEAFEEKRSGALPKAVRVSRTKRKPRGALIEYF